MALQPTPSRLSSPTVETSPVAWTPATPLPRARRNSDLSQPASTSAAPTTLPSAAGPPSTRPNLASPNARSMPIGIKRSNERMHRVRDRVRRNPTTGSARAISERLKMETCAALTCERPQSEWGVFCRLLLADGERCSNFVPNPHKFDVCDSGWHEENQRSSHVTNLLIRRRQWNYYEAYHTITHQAELTAFFNSLYPDLASGPYVSTGDVSSSSAQISTRTSSSDHGSSSSSSEPELLLTPRLGPETKWADVELSDAWIQNWGLKLPVSITASPSTSVSSADSSLTLTEDKPST